mgnify:CR=1 FL=1
MKTKKSARANSFHSKLAAYSATATAVLLTAPVVADAAIQNITTGDSFTFNYSDSPQFITQGFDAGIAHSLYFWGRQSAHSTHGSHVYKFNGIGIGAKVGGQDYVAAGEIVSGAYSFHPLTKISDGAPVAGLNFFQGGNGGPNMPYAFSATAHTSTAHATPLGGNFKPAGSHTPAVGYIGFKQVNGTHTYYGWLRISVSETSQNQPLSISLVDNGDGIYGAFGLRTDGIKAGETASPVPEPSVAAIGGLGLLALGAAGVRELRRRRKQEVKN